MAGKTSPALLKEGVETSFSPFRGSGGKSKRRVLFFGISLLLTSCVDPNPEESADMCVIYDGYNQIWVRSVKERRDGSLDVIDRDGIYLNIKSYSSFDCDYYD